MLWILLLACQEPFGFDRHDLRGLRIAALIADVTETSVQPRVAIVHNDRLWSDAPLQLDWAWIDNPGDSELFPAPIASGPSPVLSKEGHRLALRVSTADATVTAELEITSQRIVPFTLMMGSLGPDLASVTADEMALENRRSWTSTPTTTLPPGGFARFELRELAEGQRGRFMGTGSGTFFEISASATDWVAGTLSLDDEEVTEREAAPEGPFTLLGLALGERNGFALRDAFIGPAPSGSWTHGRFLEGGLTVPYEATLQLDDLAPTGLALTDISPSSGPAPLPPCANVSGPFNPNWLLEQRCSRAELIGQRVYIEPEP